MDGVASCRRRPRRIKAGFLLLLLLISFFFGDSLFPGFSFCSAFSSGEVVGHDLSVHTGGRSTLTSPTPSLKPLRRVRFAASAIKTIYPRTLVGLRRAIDAGRTSAASSPCRVRYASLTPSYISLSVKILEMCLVDFSGICSLTSCCCFTKELSGVSASASLKTFSSHPIIDLNCIIIVRGRTSKKWLLVSFINKSCFLLSNQGTRASLVESANGLLISPGCHGWGPASGVFLPPSPDHLCRSLVPIRLWICECLRAFVLHVVTYPEELNNCTRLNASVNALTIMFLCRRILAADAVRTFTATKHNVKTLVGRLGFKPIMRYQKRPLGIITRYFGLTFVMSFNYSLLVIPYKPYKAGISLFFMLGFSISHFASKCRLKTRSTESIFVVIG